MLNAGETSRTAGLTVLKAGETSGTAALTMLNVEVQLDMKMDPAINDRRSLIGPLGSYLPHLSQWPALHAEDPSTRSTTCKAISPTVS